MSEMILFTKPDCQKCEYVKERMPEISGLQMLDATTVDGLTEAALYEIIEKPFPVFVVDDEIITGAIEILGRMNVLSQ